MFSYEESSANKHVKTAQWGMAKRSEAGVPYVCLAFDRIDSRGLWYGDDPLAHTFSLLMLQLTLISILTRSLTVILKRCAQPSFISHILGGIILGPSILGRFPAFAARVFPLRGVNVLETLSLFGFMLFLFQIGVKMDPTIVLKSGKKALAIGVLCFVLPNGLGEFTAFVLKRSLSLDEKVSGVLSYVVTMQSMSPYPVVAVFLAELEILNSEIGRLAAASSIVCDLCYWSFMSMKNAITLASKMSLKMTIGFFLSDALLLSFIIFGIRSGALWVVQHSPEGKPVKEIYIFSVFVTLLVCGLLGEFIGLTAFTASFYMGLIIPDGPPLGAALSERLDCFVSTLLMPIFFTICGLRMNIFSIQKLQNVGVIQLVVFTTIFGKILGAMLPPLLCRMPFRDALALGFIMNCKGTIQVAMLIGLKIQNVMNEECFTIMIVSVVLETGFISPIIKALYDPSRRFLAYKRRTILHHRQDEELRVLTCIHGLENANAMLELLVASYPTHQSPIDLVVLHLVKLAGSSSSVLVPHQPRESSFTYTTQSEQIFSAFRKLEEHFKECIKINCYKAIAPYATMYNDVCSVALDKRTTFIIIPFHKQRTVGEGLKSSSAIRQLNKNVFAKAPCTVGVLVDNGNQRSSAVSSRPGFRQVAVLFFGGADDREALAYSGRMVEHDSVQITLFHFSSSKDIVGSTARSKMLDTEILNRFRLKSTQNKRVSYQEKMVMDSGAVISVLKSLENVYDLATFGRRHVESWLISDLRRWSNVQGELGVIGNTLASFDDESKVSILVMQQQTRLWGLRDPEESLRLRRVKI